MNNSICNLLEIKYPIIQAPMNWVSGSELVAAVSNAGGLGTLGPNSGGEDITTDVELTGERMRNQIQKVRKKCNSPFAVNIVVGAGEGLNFSRKIVEVVVEEKVPVAVVSVGRPDIYTNTLKKAGVKVLHAVSTPKHGQNAEHAGVDAVICEGFEAGGHKGFTELTTFTLTPMVADAVNIPVIAGGGIGDARGVLAAMVLGADGVYLGTRFMASKESESHNRVKEAIVDIQGVCTVSIPKESMLARDLINNFTREYLEMKNDGVSATDLKNFIQKHSTYYSQHLGKIDESEICCGQVAGLINQIEGAGEIVDNLTQNIVKRFEELKDKLQCFNDGLKYPIIF